jgi:hypothetical protein
MYRFFTTVMIGALLLLAALFCRQAIAMPDAPEPRTETGTVAEVIKVPGYTYLLVDRESGQSWVAIPAADVEIGARVSYTADMTMNNFTSKALNRTFDTIIFSSGLLKEAGAAPAKPKGDDSFAAAVKSEQKQEAAPAMPAVSGGSTGAVTPLQEVAVAKAQGDNAYRVEEIYARAGELNGKKVRVQGKVVKFNASIMGKNWVHLQDGTGNPMQNTHDLVFTTGETVELNSVVTLEGTLAADKDFGAGYKYAAIVEQAILIK